MRSERTTREGSATKREAILSAAQLLFLDYGYDRTSMDAIASAAKVSKRTVYDYFGEKANLWTAVLNAAAEATLETLRSTLQRHLSDKADIPSQDALENALVAFATDLAMIVTESSSYATIHKFTSGPHGKLLHTLSDPDAMSAPEEALAERLAHFSSAGLLDVTDSREAATHFNALTILLAYGSQRDPSQADPTQIERSITGGVRAFMRAYGCT